MDTIEAIHGRRSVRAYSARSVDRPVIESLIWTAAQAPIPPASGVRPWAFSVVQGVAPIAAFGERAKAFARDHPPPGRGGWIEDPAFKVFWDAPALIVISGRTDNPEAAWDCCRAGQTLMLAAYAMGLGTCWVGAPLPWLRTPEVAVEVGIPDGFEAVAPIILGHVDAFPPPRTPARPDISWRGLA